MLDSAKERNPLCAMKVGFLLFSVLEPCHRPYVWTWIGTPVITGTHVYTFTADGLDAPTRGLVFARGSAVYLPVIFGQ